MRCCSLLWLPGDFGDMGEGAALLVGACWLPGVCGSGGAAIGYLVGGVGACGEALCLKSCGCW